MKWGQDKLLITSVTKAVICAHKCTEVQSNNAYLGQDIACNKYNISYILEEGQRAPELVCGFV